MQRDSHRRDAFTLIELLVSVAIIALLISILLPSLQAAREAGKSSACLSMLKNIATTSSVYEADDPNGWGIPAHPGQFRRTVGSSVRTYVGAYEWGGKSGIGRADYLASEDEEDENPAGPLNSKYGTRAGFGPGTRPMNALLYKGGFRDNRHANDGEEDIEGMLQDTKLDLGLFRCPSDTHPPRGGHCPDWVRNAERSSYDHYGNSFAANLFNVWSGGGGQVRSNSPYLRPISRVPTPSRTLYYEENIGRWAWAVERDRCAEVISNIPGIDPGPTNTIVGWHGIPWRFQRAFVDGHAEVQSIIEPGTEDVNGFFFHYRREAVAGLGNNFRCITVRGEGWTKDTLPAPLIPTTLSPPRGPRRGSYEHCVAPRGRIPTP